MSAVLRLFSFRGVQKLSRLLADFSFHVLRIRRKVATENLRNAFPGQSEAWIRSVARRSQHGLFLSMLEFLYSSKLSADELLRLFTFSNVDVVFNAFRRNRGVIFMTGHFGNWELLATATTLFLNSSGLIIVKRQKNHFIDTMINNLRTRLTNRIVYMKESVREIIKTLDENGVVAMIADQSAPRDSVYVPFFGRAVATFAGPAYFALRTGAPLLMGLSIRRPDGTYEAVFEEVQADDLKEANKENIEELTARHTAVLEKYIRQYPDHWLWQHRRWKYTKVGKNE
jgi:Kdo2-lipid IVA lauroyltransferase/acyltransferase